MKPENENELEKQTRLFSRNLFIMLSISMVLFMGAVIVFVL